MCRCFSIPPLPQRSTPDHYALFANGPWLTKRAMEAFWNAYLPDVTMRKQNLRGATQRIDGLADGPSKHSPLSPRNDVLRDEGECYARRLARAGVRVTYTRYNYTINDFVMLNALALQRPAGRVVTDSQNEVAKARHICSLPAGLSG